MSTIGGFLPPWFSNKLNEQKKAAKVSISSIFDCEEDSNAKAFVRAKEEIVLISLLSSLIIRSLCRIMVLEMGQSALM